MIPPLRHILCIDDEDDILYVLRIALESIGHFSVTTINGSAEAVANAGMFIPDLILLDVMMPEMDGPTTLAKLRENPNLEKVPIVFMTARVQPKEVEEYMALGAFGVIRKPFDPMRVCDEITQLWQQYHAQHA